MRHNLFTLLLKLGPGWEITLGRKLWHLLTYPCPWPHLVHASSILEYIDIFIHTLHYSDIGYFIFPIYNGAVQHSSPFLSTSSLPYLTSPNPTPPHPTPPHPTPPHPKPPQQVGSINTLRPIQNGQHFPDDIFQCIFLNENIWIWNTIWLKFVPKGRIDNSTASVQVMAWYQTGDKPLSEPMMALVDDAHICVTQPEWVKLVPYHHC